MKPPWWFCCGWWSPWCVLDVAAHVVFRNAGEVELPIDFRWICVKHDASIMREVAE